MKKLFNHELLQIMLLLLLAIGIRSIHFPQFLNFSSEQGLFSLRALQIWQNKEITLIGPSISPHFIGRDLFQGSLTYYVLLIFLLLGHLDPVTSSYLFMLFACFMMILLYYGVKMLLDKRAALFVCILYALLPLSIDYSRFFWNPTFQYASTPLLILFMGLFHKKKHYFYLFLTAFISGVFLLFHYQYVVIIFGLFIYYFLIKRAPLKFFLLFFAGVVLGFSPQLLFEVRSHFYNTQTLILYLTHYKQTVAGSGFNLHYILSSSLFMFLILAAVLKKHLKSSSISVLLLLLLLLDGFLYLPTPSHGFGMAKDWNYPDEQKVHEIIMKQNLQNYNIVNQIYDTKAQVQKYLLKKDKVTIDEENYRSNQYLYILSGVPYPQVMNDAAYEINTFQPSTLIKSYQINTNYNLYILKRKS